MIGVIIMKNRNVLFTVLGIIVLVVLMIGVFYHFRDRRTYTLNLPKLEKLESISLKQNEKNVIIDDKEKMQQTLILQLKILVLVLLKQLIIRKMEKIIIKK